MISKQYHFDYGKQKLCLQGLEDQRIPHAGGLSAAAGGLRCRDRIRCHASRCRAAGRRVAALGRDCRRAGVAAADGRLHAARTQRGARDGLLRQLPRHLLRDGILVGQPLHVGQADLDAGPQPECRSDQGQRQDRQPDPDRSGARVAHQARRYLQGGLRDRRRLGDARAGGERHGAHEHPAELRQRAERRGAATGRRLLCLR